MFCVPDICHKAHSCWNSPLPSKSRCTSSTVCTWHYLSYCQFLPNFFNDLFFMYHESISHISADCTFPLVYRGLDLLHHAFIPLLFALSRCYIFVKPTKEEFLDVYLSLSPSSPLSPLFTFLSGKYRYEVINDIYKRDQ